MGGVHEAQKGHRPLRNQLDHISVGKGTPLVHLQVHDLPQDALPLHAREAHRLRDSKQHVLQVGDVHVAQEVPIHLQPGLPQRRHAHHEVLKLDQLMDLTVRVEHDRDNEVHHVEKDDGNVADEVRKREPTSTATRTIPHQLLIALGIARATGLVFRNVIHDLVPSLPSGTAQEQKKGIAEAVEIRINFRVAVLCTSRLRTLDGSEEPHTQTCIHEHQER
mmetsp:Transcript_124883/g.296331  ORF Transcript_124883/g.296331 Transcript_124883/m.296331 type:complete len:220 (+) Transcript_124883:900-1559(+)